MNKMTTVSLYHWILLTVMMGITSEIKAMPLADNADHDLNPLISRETVMVPRTEIQEGQLELEVRDKRHIQDSNETPEILINKTQSNETSFEDYEKEYLINLNMELLEQFLHYDSYLKHLKEDNSSNKDGSTTASSAVPPDPPTPLPHSGDHTTPDVRVDNRILEQKISELRGMSVNQLESVFHSLHRAAKDGVEDPGITSLCCNIG
ncbi:uncharacterized protein LOC123547162 [Mercenaria mercenaria]|uniref:uncharacterized protein LOC123547162 n=1 Tax=Mercenaria mercenaria TaxID=6596 RepID=UPI00234E7B79|nr:uncharacterized protein LOC123547162 [Mercenaria mercenaria]